MAKSKKSIVKKVLAAAKTAKKEEAGEVKAGMEAGSLVKNYKNLAK